jgi:uncharacterized protein DUF397
MTPDPTTLRWRKSSYSSGQNGECVELACLDAASWRKSSYSSGQGGACVELAYLGAMRDSKNPAGPALAVGDLPTFVNAVKQGRL